MGLPLLQVHIKPKAMLLIMLVEIKVQMQVLMSVLHVELPVLLKNNKEAMYLYAELFLGMCHHQSVEVYYESGRVNCLGRILD